MAYDEAVTIRDRDTSYGVALFGGNGWRFERAEVEEDHYFGCCHEFAEKLGEYCWCCFACFIEEDTKSFNHTQLIAAVLFRQPYRSTWGRPDEMRGRESVFGLGLPLIFLAKSPKDEQRSDERREEECEPSTVGDFDEGRGEVGTIEAGDG